jgi:hypothetical protein
MGASGKTTGVFVTYPAPRAWTGQDRDANWEKPAEQGIASE